VPLLYIFVALIGNRCVFSRYEPSKVKDVDKLMQKVGDSEANMEALMSKLVEKYGPEPLVSDPIMLRKRVRQFYKHYNPDKLNTVQDLVKRTKGKAIYELRLMAMLVEKYGDEPAMVDDGSDTEEQGEDDVYSFGARLTRFYRKYAPEKISDVPKLVEKTEGKPRNEEKLMAMLVNKYGSEPEDNDSSESEGELSGSEEEEEASSGLFRKIVYCPVDGMPPEYCEYLPSFTSCLPWLEEHTPGLVLTSKKGVTVKEYAAKLKSGDAADDGSKKSSRGGASRPNKLKGKKGPTEQAVTIMRVKRQKKKFVTSIIGLDSFDIKLKEAAKKLSKKFASSASITKQPNGAQSIDIQGDVMYDLPEVIIEYYPQVDKSKITMQG